MSSIATSPSSPGLNFARKLAAEHPRAKLPCPVCAASLQAGNLDKHLAKTHASGGPVTANDWTGIDRGMLAVAIAALIVGALVLAAVVVQSDLPGEAGTMGVVMVPTVLGPLVLLLLAFKGSFKARLTLAGDRLRLRRTLGLRTRVVRLPASIEVGSLVETQGDPTLSSYHDQMHVAGHGGDQAVGSYLRLADKRAVLTIGARRKSGVRHHWDAKGWCAGPRRRSCDIEVDGPTMVAIEYMLAERGLLSPRTD